MSDEEKEEQEPKRNEKGLIITFLFFFFLLFFFFFFPFCLMCGFVAEKSEQILYALIARGQTSLVDYSTREGNHVLLAQQILAKAKQDTVRSLSPRETTKQNKKKRKEKLLQRAFFEKKFFFFFFCLSFFSDSFFFKGSQALVSGPKWTVSVSLHAARWTDVSVLCDCREEDCRLLFFFGRDSAQVSGHLRHGLDCQGHGIQHILFGL